MRDLTSRALDTATALGATYADVRVVRRLEESINIKSTPRRGRLSPARARASASASSSTAPGASPRATTCRLPRPTASPPRPSGSRRPAPPPCATAVRPRRPPARPRPFETPVDEDPFAVPLDRKIADLLAADREMNTVKGIAFTEIASTPPNASGRRSPPATAATRSRRSPTSARPRGQRHRRRRAPAPELPGQRRRLGVGGLRVRSAAWTSRATRSGPPSEAVELLTAPPLPAGHAHDPPPPEPAVHAGPRELRPPDGARPRLRHRGQLRRHQLPDAGHARAASATARTSCTSSPTPRSPAASAPSAGTTRASRPSGPPRQGRASSSAT